MAVLPTSTNAWSIATYGKAEDLRLSDQPVRVLGSGEMLVKIEAAGLNPLDLKLITGQMRELMPVDFPFVPGSDLCGHVVAIGGGVTGYKEGDRIVAMTSDSGAMARYAVCAQGPLTAHAPDTLSAAQLATLTEVGVTAKTIMRAAELEAGDSLLIIGATGGIGQLLCQFADKLGARVIATAEPQDDQFVRSLGAIETIDHTRGEAVDLLRSKHPDGVRVVVDLVNVHSALFSSAKAVAKGGRLLSTLAGPDPGEFPGEVEVHYIQMTPQPGDLEGLVSGLVDGSLKTRVLRTFPFAEVPDAYAALRDDHPHGKIAVQMSP